MNAFLCDLRHAVRLLWKSPTFTLTAVLCLGLAIGANTTLFGILNSLLWKPLPVEQPGRLVRVFAKTGESHVLSGHLYQGFSYPEYVDYRDGNRATCGVQLGFRAEGSDAIRVFGEAVSDNYFEMLGVRARLGRVLASGPGGALNTAPEVVLSSPWRPSRWRCGCRSAPCPWFRPTASRRSTIAETDRSACSGACERTSMSRRRRRPLPRSPPDWNRATRSRTRA
jgi:hypothetical protein